MDVAPTKKGGSVQSYIPLRFPYRKNAGAVTTRTFMTLRDIAPCASLTYGRTGFESHRSVPHCRTAENPSPAGTWVGGTHQSPRLRLSSLSWFTAPGCFPPGAFLPPPARTVKSLPPVAWGMGKQLRMENGDVVDVNIKLKCTECHGHGGVSEAPGGAITDWHRKDTDPKSVVRCSECGKRHSADSLVDTTVDNGN